MAAPINIPPDKNRMIAEIIDGIYESALWACDGAFRRTNVSIRIFMV